MSTRTALAISISLLLSTCTQASSLCPFAYLSHNETSWHDLGSTPLATERRDAISGLILALRTQPEHSTSSFVLRADHISYTHEQTVLNGHISILHPLFHIQAQEATYQERTHLLDSHTPTLLKTEHIVVRAQQLHFDIEHKTGELHSVDYQIHHRKQYKHYVRQFISSGHGDSIRFDGDQYFLNKATYSTCPATHPLWFISADTITVSPDDDEIFIEGAQFHLLHTPIFYLPFFHFPLHNKRESGFLTPLYAQNEKTGLSLALPYYFNLSENYDFTFTPYYMDKSGLSLQGDFRLLSQEATLSLQGEYLAVEKKQSPIRRYAVNIQGFRQMTPHWHVKARFSHVSDSNYFSDVSSQIGNMSTILLPTYLDSEWLFQRDNGVNEYRFFIQKYQLAYQPQENHMYDMSIRLPYTVLPSLSSHYLRYGLLPIPWEIELSTSVTQFQDPYTQHWDAWRAVIRPNMTTHLELEHITVSPSIGAQSNYYLISLHGHLPWKNTITDRSPSFTVPYFSTDIVSRSTLSLANAHHVLVLTPHVYYLFVPKVTQNKAPIFDTTIVAPNFPSIYSHYLLTGSDRQPNANQLSTGLDFAVWSSSQQHILFSGQFAERYYFEDSVADLPQSPPIQGMTPFDPLHQTLINKKGTRDDLLALNTHLTTHLMLSTFFQFGRGAANPHHGLYQFYFLSTYQGDSQHLLSAGLSYKKYGVSEITLSGMIPLSHTLSAIAAIHYAINDRSTYPNHSHFFSNSIIGLQYINCCIASELIFTYTRSPVSKPIKTLFLRFVIGGLGQIGQNKTGLLKYEIPGYHDFVNDQEFTSHP